MPGLREREQIGQKRLLETGLPLANRSHCLKITTLLWQNMNQSRGGRFPFLMSNVNKISLQPRALCFRDLREGEPRNSHPHIQALVVWRRYSVPSGHRPPSRGDQVPGKTALQFASGLCTQISLVGNQNAQFRVQAGAGGAGMQWGLFPVWQEEVPRARSGSGGSAALPDSQSRCSSLTVSSCKALLQSLQGSRAGTASELYSLSHLCFPNTFPIPLLLFALPFPPKN